LFDGITNTTTDNVFTTILSQIVSIGVVHGERVCHIAAEVRTCSCYQHRMLSH